MIRSKSGGCHGQDDASKFRHAANIEYESDPDDPTEGVRHAFEYFKKVLLGVGHAAAFISREAESMTVDYLSPEQAPSRRDVDSMPGPVLLEFGTPWCGFCQAIEPRVAAILRERPEVRHIRVEDGPGLPLGRSFRVKLWPNFVFLKDGVVVHQLARPDAAQLVDAFEALTAAHP